MADDKHILFLWTPSGYRIEEREGEPPAVGTQVEFDGRAERVSKIAPSPLPGDARRCAYLQG